MSEAALQSPVARVEAGLAQLEELRDPAARAAATDAIAALLDLYGEALAKLLELGGSQLAVRAAGDELVAHLLLVHGLHPVPLAERVEGALSEVRPYLESHGGGVALLGIEEGVVRLRLQGSCSGCPSSAVTLRLAVEEAIQRAAPDVEAIEAADEEAAAPNGLIQLESLLDSALPMAPVGAPSWIELEAPALADGGTVARDVAGRELLLASLGGALYAYRDACPACGGRLAGTAVERAAIACPGCGRRYSVSGAGRALDDAGGQLEPVPLLNDGAGRIRVAVAVA